MPFSAGVVQLREQARQHQRDRPGARVRAQLALEPLEVGPTEPMQRGDGAGLVEVGHDGTLTHVDAATRRTPQPATM